MQNDFLTTEPTEALKKAVEKKKIRSTAKFIGLAMLNTVAISFLWGSVYIYIMTRLGIDANTAIKWVNEPAILQLVNQILSTIMFTLPFLVILSGCGHRLHEIVSFQKPKGDYLLPIILISLGFCSFANIAGSTIIALLAGFGITVPDPMPQQPEGFFGIAVTFIGTSVVAPVIEEFAMRGIVMGSLRKFGDGIAIFVSALFFGLIHGNLMQMPFAFLVGLALGFAVIKTGSLWAGIIIHAINNGVATLLDLATDGLSVGAKSIVTLLYFIACMLLAFIGAALFKGRSAEALSIEKADMLHTPRQTAKILFSSPLIIVYLFFAVIQTLISLG